MSRKNFSIQSPKDLEVEWKTPFLSRKPSSMEVSLGGVRLTPSEDLNYKWMHKRFLLEDGRRLDVFFEKEGLNVQVEREYLPGSANHPRRQVNNGIALLGFLCLVNGIGSVIVGGDLAILGYIESAVFALLAFLVASGSGLKAFEIARAILGVNIAINVVGGLVNALRAGQPQILLLVAAGVGVGINFMRSLKRAQAASNELAEMKARGKA